MASGYGTMTYKDGEVYRGEWQLDKRHGKGVCYYPNSAFYTGHWFEVTVVSCYVLQYTIR